MTAAYTRPLRSGRSPRPGRTNGTGRDSTATYKEVTIVQGTLRPDGPR
jgi:hypothetical protein